MGDAKNTAVKIADFGFAKDISNSPASTVLGTARYVAPEQLDANPYDGSKADMWACGVILYIMREAEYPFRLAGTGGVGEPGQHFATEDTLRLKEELEAAQYSFKKPEQRGVPGTYCTSARSQSSNPLECDASAAAPMGARSDERGRNVFRASGHAHRCRRQSEGRKARGVA